MRWSLADLQPRDRRALALAGIVLVPVALFFGAVRPYASALAQSREQVASQAALLGREQALLARTRAHWAEPGEAGGTRRGETLGQRLLRSRDPLLAAGELAGYVDAVARASGVRLELTPGEVAPGDSSDLVAVPVEVRASGGAEGVLLFLTRLEWGPLLLRVDRLTMTGTEASARSAGDSTPAEARLITLSARISGYTPREGPPSGAPVSSAGSPTDDAALRRPVTRDALP